MQPIAFHAVFVSTETYDRKCILFRDWKVALEIWNLLGTIPANSSSWLTTVSSKSKTDSGLVERKGEEVQCCPQVGRHNIHFHLVEIAFQGHDKLEDSKYRGVFREVATLVWGVTKSFTRTLNWKRKNKKVSSATSQCTVKIRMIFWCGWNILHFHGRFRHGLMCNRNQSIGKKENDTVKRHSKLWVSHDGQQVLISAKLFFQQLTQWRKLCSRFRRTFPMIKKHQAKHCHSVKTCIWIFASTWWLWADLWQWLVCSPNIYN